MDKEKLKNISKNLSADSNDFMSAFRQNMFMYIDEKDITIKDISEESDVPFSTLNTFLYGNSKDIKLSTAVKLAKALNVSIDELLENDIKNVLETKVSNTERLAGVIIKILKVMGILLALYFVIAIVSFILFGTMKKTTKEVETTTSVSLVCTLDGKTYDYYMEDENDKLIDFIYRNERT